MPPAAPVTSTTFMAPQGVRTACPWLRDWRGVLRPWCSNRYENRVCMPACPEAGNPAATALLRTHPRRLPILGRRLTLRSTPFRRSAGHEPPCPPTPPAFPARLLHIPHSHGGGRAGSQDT